MTPRPRHVGAVLFCLAVASCAPRDTASVTSGPIGADDEELRLQRHVADLVGETEQTRELELLRPVEAVTMSSEEIRALVQAQVAKVDMSIAQRIMQAFGFAPAGLDLEELMVDLLAQEVLGMYDPDEDRLIVLDRITREIEESADAALLARMVLVHELTHALQDQHFTTLEHTGEEVWSDDASSVFSCLAEGDATLTMMVSSLRDKNLPVDPTAHPRFRDILRAQGESALPQSPAMSAAPPYFGHVFASIYLEGAAFAAELRALGGWRAVDDAHRRPPRSTRDILHVELYLEGAPLVELELPDSFPGLDDGGYERVASKVLGELEAGAFLLPLDDTVRLRRAAEGWAGDRFAVYERAADGALALVWRLRFVDESEASEYLEAAHDTTVASGRGPCEEDPLQAAPPVPNAARRILCRGGSDLLERRGSDVVILRDVPRESAASIADAAVAGPAIERREAPPQPEVLRVLSERAQREDQSVHQEE